MERGRQKQAAPPAATPEPLQAHSKQESKLVWAPDANNNHSLAAKTGESKNMFASGKDAISRGGATGNVGKLWRVKEQKSIRDDPSSSFRTIIVDRVRSVRGLQCMSEIEKV